MDTDQVMSDQAQQLRSKLIRNFDEATLTDFIREPLYASRYAGLSDGTVATKLGCAIDIVAPGKQSCPYHFHYAQEELFIILQGEGTLRVADERIPIKHGDVIFIPAGPQYPHHILNTSDHPLKYLSLSTKEYPELCVYPDSGKTMAWHGKEKLLNRQAANLDYWDGEP